MKNLYDSKILIVDDTIANLQVLAKSLIAKGFDVSVAQDGQAALESARFSIPDLILLDVAMPDLNGFQVCEILKKESHFQNIPILFLTARSQEHEILKGFEVGGTDYITKPFNLKEMIMRVETHLERKLYADQLKERKKQLMKLNETNSQLLSIISHDLRGMLANILSASEMIPFIRENDERLLQFTEIIQSSSHNASLLLENILHWSKTQNTDNQVDFTEINFADVVRSVLEILAPLANSKHILLQRQCPPVIVYADLNMLLTILRNLVSNAIKFTPNDGDVYIKSEEKDDFLWIHVIDNGIGISDENIAKILNTENHFTTRGTNNEKGTGLGLQMVKDFVHKNKGEIHIEHNPNGGTIFSFSILLAKLEDE